MKRIYDPRNQKDVEDKQTAEDIARGSELRDLRDVLQTEPGKRFLNRLFAKCKMYNTSFTGNSTTFFNEGKRSVALEIFEDMAELANNRELTPETLVSLMLNQVKEDDNG